MLRVSCEGLTKTYGSTRALDGVTVQVNQGEVFGLIGPNGAGKTTLLECWEGLRRPDSGALQVLGLNPEVDRRALFERLGVQLQGSAVLPRLKVGERVFIALAMVNDPEVVFLDELTTALDPRARREMWSFVLRIRQEGVGVVLSTHYLQEAEALCDRVAVLGGGRVLALDTVSGLTDAVSSGRTVTARLGDPAALDGNELSELDGVSRGSDGRGRSGKTVLGVASRDRAEHAARASGSVLLGGVFGVRPQGSVRAVAIAATLGAVAFLALGYLLAALLPSQAVVVPVCNILVIVMLLFSGATAPLAALPPWARDVAQFSPMTQLVNFVSGLWSGEAWAQHRVAVAALLGVTAVAGGLAAWRFRWE